MIPEGNPIRKNKLGFDTCFETRSENRLPSKRWLCSFLEYRQLHQQIGSSEMAGSCTWTLNAAGLRLDTMINQLPNVFPNPLEIPKGAMSAIHSNGEYCFLTFLSAQADRSESLQEYVASVFQKFCIHVFIELHFTRHNSSMGLFRPTYSIPYSHNYGTGQHKPKLTWFADWLHRKSFWALSMVSLRKGQ